jgi:hypothetical protein
MAFSNTSTVHSMISQEVLFADGFVPIRAAYAGCHVPCYTGKQAIERRSSI